MNWDAHYDAHEFDWFDEAYEGLEAFFDPEIEELKRTAESFKTKAQNWLETTHGLSTVNARYLVDEWWSNNL